MRLKSKSSTLIGEDGTEGLVESGERSERAMLSRNKLTKRKLKKQQLKAMDGGRPAKAGQPVKKAKAKPKTKSERKRDKLERLHAEQGAFLP